MLVAAGAGTRAAELLIEQGMEKQFAALHDLRVYR
jgi:hypothetical protein